MSTEAIAVTLLVGVFLVLLFLRVSVAVSMGIAAIVTYAYLKLPLALVVQYTVGGLMTIVIIFAGVTAGIMTATESAAVAALWSFICAFFIYRDVPLKKYYDIATAAIKMLSTIMILLAIANAFGWVVAYLRIPNKVAAAILSLTDSKVLILILINLLILFLGCIMSISSILLIITPIIVPILTALDYNLVQFGVVMILNLGVGLLTPPVGAALYVGSAVSGLGVGKTAKSLLPFYLIMVATLFALAFIPGISRILGAW